MAQQIEISDATFERLQKLAVPLVDNTESVIKMIAEFYERDHATRPNSARRPATNEPKPFSVASPPNLTHTKVLSVELDGTPLAKTNWNGLLFEMVRRAKDRINGGDDVRKIVVVKYVKGKKEDEGYRFIPEVDLSVQGQDANSAWRGACHIAKQLGIPVEVDFLWRAKDGAEFPGVTGRLST